MDNNIMGSENKNLETESLETEILSESNRINENESTEIHGDTFVMKDSSTSNTPSFAEDKTETIKYSDSTENSISTPSHYSYMKSSNTSTTYNNLGSEKHEKKSGTFKKVMSYVLVGVICTTIGGAASGAAILYGLPKTNMFKNTALYKSMTGGVNTMAPAYDNHPTQLVSDKGSMSISEIAKKVGPAVVAVTTTTNGGVDFFGRQGVQQGVGSGMIINKDGYVLTNYHVVEGAQQVKVVLSNGKQANAKVVNYDASYDVAVVKITDKIDLPAVVELGDSSTLQVGEDVVAIGNPLGTDFFGSVTTGIVSALNRKINGDTNKATYIQTDAAINSGNSGGPLINSRGQVVGINTAKIKENGVEGLGFAIPINAVKDKIPNLSKPILLIGIQGREIDDQLAKQYNMPIGLYVQQITEFSPAEKAGIKSGDVIVKFDGEKVKTFDDVNNIKNKHKVGDSVSVTINRDGKEQTLNLKFTEQQ